MVTSQRDTPTVGSSLLPGRKQLGVVLLHLALAKDVCDCVIECALQEWTFSNVYGFFTKSEYVRQRIEAQQSIRKERGWVRAFDYRK